MLLLSLSMTVYSQKVWTLRECIDYAVENNIEIRQQELAVKQSETELNSRRGGRLPGLSAGVSESFNFGRSQSMETGIYEERQTSSTGLSASASLPIFAGFSVLNNIRVAKLNLQASLEGLQKAKENLEIQVTYLYLEVLFKKEMCRVYEHQAALTAEQVRKTEVLVETGKVPRSQLLDMRAQQAQLRLGVVNAENDLQGSRLNLAQALNLAETTWDIAEPETATDMVAAIESPEEIFAEVWAQRPAVREAELRWQSSLKGVEIAKASLWPSLSLGASYATGFSHIIKAPGDIGYDEPAPFEQLKNNQRQAVSLNLSIPLFGRLQNRNGIRSARLTAESRELELESVKQALLKEIQQACQSVDAAKAKYEATGAAVEAAEEALLYARERYDVGRLTAYELGEAQAKSVGAQSERLQAKYEFLFRSKIIDFYKGERIDM